MKIRTRTSNLKYLTCMAGLLLTGAVQAADEAEPNNDLASAQIIIQAGETRVNGALVSQDSQDVDYYRVYAREGNVLTVAIENATVNTYITVMDAAGNLQREADYATLSQDPVINGFNVPATGNYYIGVTGSRAFDLSGSLSGGSLSLGGAIDLSTTTTYRDGNYTLFIDGLPSKVAEKVNQVKTVSIDVKPGDTKRSPLNHRSNGVVPVAILSHDGFEPMKVDADSLTFGHGGDENTLHKCQNKGRDINRDGVKDLVCTFSTRNAGFTTSDLEGVLKGKMKNGSEIKGQGPLKVVSK